MTEQTEISEPLVSDEKIREISYRLNEAKSMPYRGPWTTNGASILNDHDVHFSLTFNDFNVDGKHCSSLWKNQYKTKLTQYLSLFDPNTVQSLLDEIERLRKFESEAEHWKANHAAEVARARVLKERKDMPLERINAYDLMSHMEEENKELKRLNELLLSENSRYAQTMQYTHLSIENNQLLRNLTERFNQHFR